jgi:pilus assembly protein Flp/PilA
MKTLRRFIADDSGATAIEYGLIAALVSVAAIVALSMLGDQLSNTFNHVSNMLGAGIKKGTVTGQ